MPHYGSARRFGMCAAVRNGGNGNPDANDNLDYNIKMMGGD